MMERYVLLVRLEADDIEPRRTAFALAEVVRQSSKPFRKQAREKGLRFKLNRLPDRAVMVYTDRSFLAQILQELLSNSVKFTRQGEIALTVEVQERTLLLHVSDTGIGIPEAALPAVFSGFRPALERAGTHTGWRPSTGLALVWGLVDAMGGRVEAASEEGHGSMFTITLPDVVTPPH